MSDNLTFDAVNFQQLEHSIKRSSKGEKDMNERLKQVRKNLKLSQEFVASQLGMTRTTIVAIEAGTRKVSTDELAKFSELYGV